MPIATLSQRNGALGNPQYGENARVELRVNDRLRKTNG